MRKKKVSISKKDVIEKKQWSCLSSLRDWIVSNDPKQKIVSFNGFELITNTARYTLGPDGLHIEVK